MIELPKRMKVAGTHVDNRCETIGKYAYRWSKFDLEREIGNPWDQNAIQVKLKFKNGGRKVIGYVPREYAAQMAPMIDDGIEFKGTFAMELVNEKTAETIGLIINVNRKDRDNGKTA